MSKETLKAKLISWLYNTYSIEKAIEMELQEKKSQSKDLRDKYNKIRMYTKKVKDCIDRLGGDREIYNKSAIQALDNYVRLTDSSEDTLKNFDLSEFKCIAILTDLLGEEEVKNTV